MRVLVTGATGFTGSHLCKCLVAHGHKVVALVRKGSNLEFLKGHHLEIVYGDLCDLASLRCATHGIDTVYHIAAIFRQEGVASEVFWKVNTEGVEHLLDASVQNGVQRFVHCSTVGVHGHITHTPANEETPYGPGDLYQRTKLEGERIAQCYMKDGMIGVTIVRPAGIYGPGDLRFLKLFRAINKRRFAMLGRGEVNYHLTYIDDLVDGIVLCGTKEKAIGEIYILGGEGYITLNDLTALIAVELNVPRPRLHIPIWPVYAAGFVFELLCKPLALEPPLYRRRIDFFRKNRAFDISKAKRELGFLPKIDVKEGTRRTARWYIDNGYL